MNGAGFLKRRGLRADLLRIPVLVLSAGINIEKNAASLKASFLQKPRLRPAALQDAGLAR